MAYGLGEIPRNASRTSAVAGETITRGQVVAIHTDGLAYLANATAGANNQVPAVGIAETDGTLAGGERITIIRECAFCDGATGLDEGAAIFLGETDGTITKTAPVHLNDVIQFVGYALTETTFVFDVGSNGFIIS